MGSCFLAKRCLLVVLRLQRIFVDVSRIDCSWVGIVLINNYVPVLMLATLSNMDFQATTTKFGVIEYMTKYMTKSGQGNLLGVMEV